MKPLSGIRILDLSRVLASPFATMILAELGAEVIKVEKPTVGDETRNFEPKIRKDQHEESAYFFAFNRSKQSVTINFKTREGQQLIKSLAAKCDVFVENFTLGTLEKYSLNYQAIKTVNPNIVYVSCTGFGLTGPYASRKGYDTVFQAMGGMMSLTGERSRGPVKHGLPIADLTSGLWLVISILSAIVGKSKTGRGCHIDHSMLDGQIGLLSLAAARYFALGEVPPRLGTEHPGRVPSAAFECADGKWVQITGSDQHWGKLCEILNLKEWSDRSNLSKNEERVNRREEVMGVLAGAIRRFDRDELCRKCHEVGVPAGPILEIDEILTNEHVQHREIVDEFEHPTIGKFKAIGIPFKFEGYSNPKPGRPPMLGEHTREVLETYLGLNEEEISQLVRKSVL